MLILLILLFHILWVMCTSRALLSDLNADEMDQPDANVCEPAPVAFIVCTV